MNIEITVELFGIALYQYAIIRETEEYNKTIAAGNDLEYIDSLYNKYLKEMMDKYKDKPIDSKETLILKDVQQNIIIRNISSFDFL